MYLANVNYFDPNPWQPRQAMDETALCELADNIRSLKGTRPKTKGLLQLPAARLVDIDGMTSPAMVIKQRWDGPGMFEGDDITPWLEACGYRLQIGIGHRRHAAFFGLAVNDPHYLTIPFELADFTDEEMFRIALSENVARADLNPIEIAQSMQRYRDDFGKSSKEIGELFGISDSAVRNLIRLLALPEPSRLALAEGHMSQGTARALLTYYALPEKLQSAHFYALNRYWRKGEIVEHAHAGAMAKDIETLIGELLRSEGKKFDDARWKATDPFEGENIHHPDCHTCPARVKNGSQYYCTVRPCYNAKTQQWERNYLTQASRAADLPVFDGDRDRTTSFEWSSRTPILTSAYERRCPNLCLAFNPASLQNNGKGYEKVTVVGFPGAEMICKKMNQHCTCLQAKEAGVSLPVPTAPTPASSEYLDDVPAPVEEPAPLTEADLKAIRQNINTQKKENQQQSKAIRLEAERQFLSTLNLFNLKAWKLVAKKIKYSCGQDAQTWDDLTSAIAAQIIQDEFEYMNLEDLDRHQRKAQELYDKLGLVKAKKEPPVSTETPPSHE